MFGAFKSINLFKRLFLFITLLYKSLRSEVANLPPSRGTKGLSSGGITGITVNIIHSGLFPVSMNDSINFNLFIDLSSATLDFVSLIVLINKAFSSSKLIDFKISSIASAPIPAVNASSPYSSWYFISSSSFNNWYFFRAVNPGSMTMKFSKYKTLSTSLSFMSIVNDILLGKDFKNQICATGVAKFICPILSLRTLDFVTSTPHFSHIIPLNFILLYFPHKHS